MRTFLDDFLDALLYPFRNRALDRAVVSELAARAPRLAREVTVDYAARTFKIDGEAFPWHLTEDGPAVEFRQGHMPVVHVSIPADTIITERHP